MYKIFINDKPFIITDRALSGDRYKELTTISFSNLVTLMDQVRKTEELQSKGTQLLTDDPTSVFVEFKSHFTSIEAGGGIVFNSNKELLLIKRAGKWDLPKGKIDKGEKTEHGAMREVEEECGVNKLTIRNFNGNSYHSYKLQGHRFLKVTHWFIMDTKFNGKLVPQKEENITDVKWVNWQKLNLETLDFYESIREVLLDIKEKIN